MKPSVTERHQKQLSVMRGWLDGKGFYLAAEALEYVRPYEAGVRKDGETPRFHHQLSVGRFVSTLAPHLMFPEETLAAAFLHDILEDHGHKVSMEDLTEKFGPKIANAVWVLSKKSNGMTKDYSRYFQDLGECPIGSIVKLADRAHNVQTMQGVFSVEKQKAYLQEVDEWFFPLVRTARRRFPRQYGAYENLKILLRCQTGLIRSFLGDNT